MLGACSNSSSGTSQGVVSQGSSPISLIAVTPNVVSASGGTAISVQGTGFVPGISVTINGIPVGDLDVVEPGRFTATTPANTSTQDLVVEFNGVATVLKDAITYLPVPSVTSILPDQGLVTGGTTITVSGHGLPERAVHMFVTINGSQVRNIEILDANTFTGVTPSGQFGPGTLEIQTVGGVSAPTTFTYTHPPAPVFHFISPNTGPELGGTFVTIKGQNFTTDTNVLVGNRPLLNRVLVDSTTIVGHTRASAVGEFRVLVTDGFSDLEIPSAFSYRPQFHFDGFSPAVQTATSQRPQSLTTGDFNKDGVPDFAFTDSLNDSVNLMFGTDSGLLNRGPSFSVSSNPRRIESGDFNNDGLLDLIVSAKNSHSLSLLLGDPQGGFTGPTVIDAGLGPEALLVVDVNNDRRLDCLVSSATSSRFSVLLGDGQGGFSRTEFPLNFSATSLIAGRFDADRHVDLALSDAAGFLNVFRGDGTGSFTLLSQLSLNGFPLDSVTGDINKDSHADLLISVGAGAVVVLLGDGQGSFTESQRLPTGALPLSIVTGDFDKDSLLDCATANGSADSVTVYFGDAQGSLSSRRDFQTPDLPLAVVIADLDRDSDLDLITANFDGQSLSVIRNNAPASSGDFGNFVNLQNRVGIADFELADFNEDGELDLFIAYGSFGTSTSWSLLLGLGLGAFGPETETPLTTRPLDSELGDFNEDGHLDVAISTTTPSLLILLGDGLGGLTQGAEILTAGESLRVRVADINEDGHQDLVTSESGANEVSIHLGDGLGGFIQGFRQSVGSAPSDALPADFDGDGKIDVLVATPDSNSISIFYGDGLGAFSAPIELTILLRPSSLAVADVNRDGLPDLISASRNTGGTRVFLGQAQGLPVQSFAGSEATGAQNVVVGDYNRDGFLDFAVGTRSGAIFFGDGTGDFPNFDVVNQAHILTGKILSVDVNRDGFLDMFTGTELLRLYFGLP